MTLARGAVLLLSVMVFSTATSKTLEGGAFPDCGRNLLRNGSFEFANRFNGMKTILNQGDQLGFQWVSVGHQKWSDVGLEQWWGEGGKNSALYAVVNDAVSGRQALKVTAPGVASTWLVYVDDVPTNGFESVVLSFRAKGQSGAAKMESEVSLYEGGAPLGGERRLCTTKATCSLSNGSSWTTGEVVLEIPADRRKPKRTAFCVRLAVTEGVCIFDDVQLEPGREATAYGERASQYLTLSVVGVNERDLPLFQLGRDMVRTLCVRNTSGRTLTGTLRMFVDSWNKTGTTCVLEKPCQGWAPDAVLSVPLKIPELMPGGYVAVASFAPYVSEKGVFDEKATGWGEVGASMLRGRNGLRFGVFAAGNPGDLFGVGNGMIGHGGWWSGLSLTNAVEAQELKPVLLGEADPFKAALLGAPNVRETGMGKGAGPGNPEANNPVSPGKINAYSPAGLKVLKERAIAFGKAAANDPSVAGAKLDNEAFFVNRGDFCPDVWADADFRAWVRRRYDGDLSAVNAAWMTAYTDWMQISQPISSITNGEIVKTGAAAIDWTASMGRMTKDTEARLRENPAYALDWMRWRAVSVVKLYSRYIRDAHTVDKKTLYGNNYPWPNFFTHIVWPQWRTHDVIMLDVQYVVGFPRTLGTNEEMIDVLEQAESIARGERPIWGREIYFQPNYPAEMSALQNWAMIAHGMSVPMTFAWKPYADSKREIFKTGPKSWLKDDAPPMWFLVDVDGSHVPGYEPNRRSTEEIAAFHVKYDGHSLKRICGDVAIYLSREESAYIMYETMDRPYASKSSKDRAALAAALRYAGVRIEYFDDKSLTEVTPSRFPVLIAPGERMISEAAEKKLKRYVKAGGVLVAFNCFNTLDVNMRPKAEPGVTDWEGDTRMRTFGGKYDSHPHNTTAFDAEIATLLNDIPEIPRRAYWENAEPRREGEEQMLPGEGRPKVEVVIREQSGTGRRFAFVLNKGGAGIGCLRGEDFKDMALRDALTGEPSPLAFALPAFGYRVLEMEKGSGE